MQRWISINGVLTPPREARVSAFDASLLQGLGLFETIRAMSGKALWLDRHLARLARSAATLGWTHAPDIDALANEVRGTLRASMLDRARVRLTVTPGPLWADDDRPPRLTTIVGVSPEEAYPADAYRDGVSATVAAPRQMAGDPTVGHKTTSYLARMATLRAAHVAGAFEALWLTPDGRVAEGAISNVFAVRDEALLTPPLDTPVLPGVTRAVLLELAEALDVPAREAPIMLDELLASDEAFITNSMMGVVPLVRIDRRPIGEQRPGQVTRALAAAYDETVGEESGHAAQ